MKVFVSELVFAGWHKLIEDSLHERLWLEAVKMPAYPDDFWTGIVWRSVGQKFSVNKLEEEKLNSREKFQSFFFVLQSQSYVI